MILTALTAFTAAALAVTPFLWPHSTALAAITLVTCAAATIGAVVATVDGRGNVLVAAAGALLALTGFAFADADQLGTLAINMVAGYTFFVAGMAPRARVTRTGVVARLPAPAVYHEEERRAA